MISEFSLFLSLFFDDPCMIDLFSICCNIFLQPYQAGKEIDRAGKEIDSRKMSKVFELENRKTWLLQDRDMM